MEKIFISNSETDTFNLGERLGSMLASGDFLALKGDLGAGKTAFTKGVARGMGIDDDVTSPTFTIINEYEGADRLIHIDTYRLNNPEELEDIGFNDYFSEGVVVMEWAERVKALLPDKILWVCFDIRGENQREIRLLSDTQYYDDMIRGLNI